MDKTRHSSLAVTDALTEKDSRSRVGRLDLSDATLEHELRLALAALDVKGFSVVFVLDELDKLTLNDDAESNVQATAIFDILASLKNFFTLGSAVYVFITDDEFFEKLSLDHRTRIYSASHTIFTDMIYVGPLHYKDIEHLIDSSVVKPLPDQSYHQFKNYVCWESNNHAFDALQVLASYEEEIDGKICLVPSESGEFEGAWREGNLPRDWLVRAALQKHIGVAYDDGRRSGPRESIFNQALWDTLHSAAARLLEGIEVAVTEAGVQELSGRFLVSLDEEEGAAVRAAVHRMLIRMERYGAVVEEEAEYISPDAPDSQPVTAQTFVLFEEVPYPPSSIKSDAVLLPVEQTLVHLLDRIGEMMGNAPEAFTLDENDAERLEQMNRLVAQLHQSGPRQTQKRSVVDRAIRDAESIADRLVHSVTRSVATEWIAAVGAVERPALTHTNPRAPEQWLTDLETDFSPLLGVLRQGNLQFVLATGERNAVLLALYPDDDDVEALRTAYESCLGKDEKSRAERERLLPLVQIGIADDGKGPRLPTEVVEYLVEERSDGILSKLFGSGTRKSKKRKEVSLQGWHTFGADPSLVNVGELAATLSKVSFIR